MGRRDAQKRPPSLPRQRSSGFSDSICQQPLLFRVGLFLLQFVGQLPDAVQSSSELYGVSLRSTFHAEHYTEFRRHWIAYPQFSTHLNRRWTRVFLRCIMCYSVMKQLLPRRVFEKWRGRLQRERLSSASLSCALAGNRSMRAIKAVLLPWLLAVADS